MLEPPSERDWSCSLKRGFPEIAVQKICLCCQNHFFGTQSIAVNTVSSLYERCQECEESGTGSRTSLITKEFVGLPGDFFCLLQDSKTAAEKSVR